MDFYHGVKTSEQATSQSSVVAVENGVTFAVGTAPVHTVGVGANKVVFAEDYASAVKALGYSDDWGKYTLCEVIKTHLKLYSVSPVIFVNVLDPEKHCSEVKTETLSLDSEKTARLSADVIANTVTVNSESGDKTYILGTDYTLDYDGEGLVVTALQDGEITETTLFVEYKEIDPSQVTKSDIIGGISVSDGSKKGLELVDSAFVVTGIVPEFIIAPGFSEDSEVAAVMGSKASAINELFKGKAIIDIDTKTVKTAAEAYQYKKDSLISGENQILCFPNVILNGVQYHLSTHIAALMALVDSSNGIPSESPSNKSLQIDETVLADGTEIYLELGEANRLNSYGITTALNFTGGFKAWGNCTACYSENTDIKDYFISVNRMFGYVAKTLIFSYWNRIDGKMTPRFVQSIVDSINIWLNGLVADGHLLGGRVEFVSGENTATDLMAGKMKYHLYLTPPSPAVEIDCVLEYDTSYLKALFA